MAATLKYKNYYLCDYETDLNTSWGSGNGFYAHTIWVDNTETVSSNKNWKLVGGVWTEIPYTTNNSSPLEIAEKFSSNNLPAGNAYDGNPATIIQDATHRFTTDAEKATWNAKQNALGAGSVSNSMLANPAVQNLSGNNTGDQTNISGNAGTATALQNARLINGISFNGSADINVDIITAAYAALGSPILAQTVGQTIDYANTSTALVDGQIKFTAVYLPKAATLTGIKVYVRVLGSYTGDNNNRVGLYTYSGGNLTLVASSANNASLWTSAANAIQTIPFSGTYSAAAGLYFVGMLYNNSAQTTAPALASGVALNNLAMSSTALGFTNSAKLHGTANGTDLTTPIAMSAITASVIPSWVALY